MNKKYPLIRLVEWIGGNKVALFFSSGKAVELTLPWVKNAKKAKSLYDGGALDIGDGHDVGSDTLAMMRGRILAPGRRGWIGS
jgi:hypothetical protein